MNLAKKLLMTTGTSSGTVPAPSGGYVDDVFSTYLYTGNGSTQTINNGIDLAGEGGLVWIKDRSLNDLHRLYDTARGLTYTTANTMYSSSTSAPADVANHIRADSTGFSLGPLSYTDNNINGDSHVSWTFRRAPKFFDVVTYTGNGVTGRQIAHSLGVQAGFITVKSTSTTGDWNSYHHSATGDLKLNLTDAQTASRTIVTAADANTFTVSGTANNNGVQYVAYVFAHDPSAEGIIQCGSFTGNTTVNIGWEPQWIMIKRTDASGDWIVIDSMRGCSVGGIDAVLNPNLNNAESTANDYIDFTATGFISKNLTGTYIYIVIRRPNKPPTTGTQVYNTDFRNATTGLPQFKSGFVTDLVITLDRDGSGNIDTVDRLRGTQRLLTHSTGAESSGSPNTKWDYMNGCGATNGSLYDRQLAHMFRRASGFMDMVCYTGTGVARTVAHNLGVAPELMIVKGRNNSFNWLVYHRDIGSGNYVPLNLADVSISGPSFWNSTAPTASVFSLGGSNGANQGGSNYVAYLFATLPGISKVGSYTGNGGSQTIPCGFTTGSRFILVKRTDSLGDWYVWDSVRGITPSNDPHLSLNTTAAEVTSDNSVGQHSSGFTVNQDPATNINVSGGSYIFLAIA